MTMEHETLWPEGGGPARVEYSTSTNGMVSVVKVHHLVDGHLETKRRVWKGETAHMDGRRYADDVILALNHGLPVPNA